MSQLTADPVREPGAERIPVVLVVEDDPATGGLVTDALAARGYWPEIVTTGRAALERASAREPDLVLLDLGLPDIDGTEVCRELRRWYTNPILVVTADGDEDRMIAALDLGADDYVTKPFSLPQLMARIRVGLRHRDALQGSLAPDAFTRGSLRIDLGGHVATVDDHELNLSPKEFNLLALLARNFGRVLTHANILQTVWGTTDLAKTETLRVHVTQLRKKLGAGPTTPRITSQAGVGYRMVDPE